MANGTLIEKTPQAHGGALASRGMTKEERMARKQRIRRAIAVLTGPRARRSPAIEEAAEDFDSTPPSEAEIGEETEDSPPIPLEESAGAVAFHLSHHVQLRQIGESLWDGVCPVCLALGHSLLVEPESWRCCSYTCAAGVVHLETGPVYCLIGGGVDDWDQLAADYPLLFESNLGMARHLADAEYADAL